MPAWHSIRCLLLQSVGLLLCLLLQSVGFPTCIMQLTLPHHFLHSTAIGQLLGTILRRNSEQGASSSSSSSNGTPLHGVKVVNNLEWFGPMHFLTFLREVGKFARVGTMLSKDSVSVNL